MMMSSKESSSQSSPDTPSESEEERFARRAEEQQLGFLTELMLFLHAHKKWWLVPLIGSLLLLGAISLLAASGAAPFIYTVF